MTDRIVGAVAKSVPSARRVCLHNEVAYKQSLLIGRCLGGFKSPLRSAYSITGYMEASPRHTYCGNRSERNSRYPCADHALDGIIEIPSDATTRKRDHQSLISMIRTEVLKCLTASRTHTSDSRSRAEENTGTQAHGATRVYSTKPCRPLAG